MSDPLFSIITVCYNSEDTIRETIRSVYHQTFNDFEYIIIDGKSSDRTVEIIKEYEKKFKEKNLVYKWVSESDTGIYNAMNKGIRKARGKIIGIINSDDTYSEKALELMNNAYTCNPKCEIFHGLLRYWSNGELVMIRGMSEGCLYNGMIEHPTCFVLRDVYKRIGFFDEQYKYVADYEFMLRAYNYKIKFYFVEEIVANFNEQGSGNSYESRKEQLKLRRKYKLDSVAVSLIKNLKIIIREIRGK